MANTYIVRTPAELSASEIKAILDDWDVDEWKEMNDQDFKARFSDSEFHILLDSDANLVSFARINFRFRVKINEVDYKIAELVGFVTTEILHDYGKELLGYLTGNLKDRQIEAIGFCRTKNSPYYESVGFKVFYDKVRHLREKQNDEWFTPKKENDIISLSLSDSNVQLFEILNDQNPAYLLFE